MVLVYSYLMTTTLHGSKDCLIAMYLLNYPRTDIASTCTKPANHQNADKTGSNHLCLYTLIVQATSPSAMRLKRRTIMFSPNLALCSFT
jgi:hypothetical protein